MLKPEISIGAGLALMTLVYAIHQNATPTIADIRTLPEGNEDIDRAEKSATMMSAIAVSAVSLIARDPILFMFGGTMVVGMSWWTKHANEVNPELRKFVPGGAVQSETTAPMETEEYTAFEGQMAPAPAFAQG